MTAPVTQPLIAYPKAWAPSFRQREAEVVFLDVKRLEDFDKYKGKLKGKYVLINDLVNVQAHFSPEANRLADSTLLKMSNADMPGGSGRGGRRGPMLPRNLTLQNWDSVWTAIKTMQPNLDSATVMRFLIDREVTSKKLRFVQEEGALCAINAGRGDGGTIFVQQSTVPQPADVPFNQRKNAYDADAPTIIPQVVMAAEHYNRLIRLIQKGVTPKVELGLEVAFTKADSGFNVIGEIQGTDLKDEVVMMGGHFDSWHAGTGATDDGTGSAAAMEAMRILQTVFKQYGIQPRRTIRIGLWGGEEQGLHGSRGYVSNHLAKTDADPLSMMMGAGSGGNLKTTPEYEKFSVYFNHDNGSGRLRGVHMQGNEAARPIFRNWLTGFNDPTAQTLTLNNTGGTDHLSFDGVGLPGFQFIQDQLEYDTRTHHSNMDVYDRVQVEDMKQAATLMAVFAYNAAQRDAKFPRKPVAAPRGPGGAATGGVAR
ncbi:MAG: M20/M25/M40 family metallo-hydrolase [Ignavibacteriales bacterium]|nr:M20/M25/M40 family metallo-hydrolase [Ignavibacteriales bacterium]